MIPMVISRIKNNSVQDQLSLSQNTSVALIMTSETAIQTAKAVVVGMVRMAAASITVVRIPKTTYASQGSKTGKPPSAR